MGKQQTIELNPSPVAGESPQDLFNTLVYDCINVINAVQDRFAIKLGKLHLGSSGERLVYNPIRGGQVTVP
jgi:hypothetical protein